jgi:acyl-coenzyme A thioesterase PaaI-like protein
MRPRNLRWLMNLWVPFLFGGIRVESISDDWRYARVRLKLRWYNRNYVRTQFGGNLFAMCDPFWMIMTLEALGRDYIVWDKAGAIDFIAPGRGDVVAEFRLEEAVLDELRAATANGDKALRWFETEVKNTQGELIARVRKQIYVRRKDKQRRE